MLAAIQAFIALITSFFKKRSEDKAIEKEEKKSQFQEAIQNAKEHKDPTQLDDSF